MLTKNQLKGTLKEVLSTQATSYEYQDTMEYLVYKAFDLGADDVDIDEHDNIYITKGNADVYPCVVAHTDTVHDIYKGYKVYEIEGNFVAYDSDSMKQVGTGGDDKVGLWVCLEMLRNHDNIKIALFSQEEIGCVGSSQARKSFFDDVGYAFECDRKGNSDFVQNSSGVKMFGKKFKKAIQPILKSYGYSITDGGLTDVHEIAQDMHIACANMSCGYYKPHSDQEYVNITDAIHTLRMVNELISTLGNTKYIHKAENTYGSYYGGWGYNYNSYGVGTKVKDYSKPIKKVKVKATSYGGCDVCGSLTTAGCDWCYKDEQPISKNSHESRPCSCGGELTAYNSGSESYRHCRDCGFYEEVSTDVLF
jgi:tripeptide aminopeptidase